MYLGICFQLNRIQVVLVYVANVIVISSYSAAAFVQIVIARNNL